MNYKTLNFFGFFVDDGTKDRKTLKLKGRCKPDGKPVSGYHLMGMWVPDLPSGGGKYRFGGDVTQTIRLPINTIRTPQSQHHFSSGYQPCAARLTSPRRLILACESKNTSKNKEECNPIADVWLNSWVGVSQTDLAANCSWQNNLSKIQTLMVWRLLFMKTLGSCKTP